MAYHRVQSGHARPTDCVALPLSDIPTNIRHRFGEKDCANLLSNPHIVQDSWNTLNRVASRYRNPHVYYGDRTPPATTVFSQDELPYGTVLLRDTYQDLSRIGRNNYFPGRNVTYKESFGQHIHSADVHNHADPSLQKHRKLKDDFVDYNEQVYVQHVSERIWSRLRAEKPQLVDWGALVASRAPLPKPMRPALKQPPQEAAPQLAPPPTTPGDKRVTISESPPKEFKTPPLSPPKESLYKANAAKPEFMRDQEFWEFYEQPVNNDKKS